MEYNPRRLTALTPQIKKESRYDRKTNESPVRRRHPHRRRHVRLLHPPDPKQPQRPARLMAATPRRRRQLHPLGRLRPAEKTTRLARRPRQRPPASF